MAKIATLTMNPAVDLSCISSHVTPDEKLRIFDVKREPGGGGLNVARVIVELGGDCLALWTCGGLNGQMLRELLDLEKINHQPLPIGEMTRENITVQEQDTNRQFRFVMPGPCITDKEAEHCLQHVRNLSPAPDYLVLSGSLPPGVRDDFYARAVSAASEKTRIVVDTSGPALHQALEAGVFLIKPNLRELGELTAQRITDDSQIGQSAREIIESGGAEIVVTSLGAGGAVLVAGDRTEFVRAPTVPIRSKVGAGDSMVGAIVYGLADGMPVSDAVRLGVAAGAAAVLTPGTRLCRREDVERLYDEMRKQER